MSQRRFIALALDEDQCAAVLAGCTAAALQISENPEVYERVLHRTGKTALELQALYTGIALYVADKLDPES